MPVSHQVEQMMQERRNEKHPGAHESSKHVVRTDDRVDPAAVVLTFARNSRGDL